MAPAQDVDPLDLASSGWGAIFAPSIGPDYEEALAPLLNLRRSNAGSLFKIFRYQAGQTRENFLASQKAGPGPADPRKVPYYLLIVGSPDEIPYRFQTELDVQYAVGRIHFDSVEDYAAYARNVLLAESAGGPLPPKEVTLFGVVNKDDTGTERAARELVEPLAAILTADRPDWIVKNYLESLATKAQLRRLLGGGETPAFLFVSAHGLAYPYSDPLQRSLQGAVLCQDWPGSGHAVLPDHYFSGEDLLDQSQLLGLILFLFGSYTAGTDEFSLVPDSPLSKRHRIAPAPFVSKLAQRLLCHPGGGALGLVGHLDRGWSTSFSWSDLGQPEVYVNTLKRLLDGHPLGSAMEFFNQRHAELAVLYSEILTDRDQLLEVDDADLARLFRAYNDLRSFVVVGDPAVRLKTRRDDGLKDGVTSASRVTASNALPGVPSPKTQQGEALDTAPLGPQPPTLAIGDIPGAINDRIAAKDELGARYYVWALADLIESRDTQPPLTIGIFGSWGMGKSFLLKHLPRVLEERAANRKKNQPEEGAARVPKIHAVEFNAWEYGASESIWPALVRKIVDQLEAAIPWRFSERFFVKLRRDLKRRLDRDRGWLFLLGFALICFLAAILLWPGVRVSKVAGALLTVSGLGVLAKLVNDALHNSLGQWIAKVFQDLDYGRPLDLIAQIRSDLELVESRLRKRGERALILIDDLDRCEPGKSVEMLQAINLLLDFESFIVCLGVDSRVVTRAVEKHYQGLLGEAGASGYEYLDKIIQIPFRIPEPSPDYVGLFIASMMGDPTPPLPVPAAEEVGREAAPASQEVKMPGPQVDLPPVAPGLAELLVAPTPTPTTKPFTYDELIAFRRLSTQLQANPRHLKRLLNVYRLVRTLARYKNEQAILRNPATTICWIVVCSQWPYTAHLMIREHERLIKLANTNASYEFPSDRPLAHLLEVAKTKGDSSRRQMLDRSMGMLQELVRSDAASMGWEELRIIRRYTINFNPAIESEWTVDSKESDGARRE